MKTQRIENETSQVLLLDQRNLINFLSIMMKISISAAMVVAALHKTEAIKVQVIIIVFK